jgi:hypothetical protein
LVLKKLVEICANKTCEKMSKESVWKRHTEQLYILLPIIIEESQQNGETWAQTMKKVDSILDKINENRRNLGILK